ncbi:hypothetical protein Mucpa_0565 [Mucilaginibacter paludis DSM 18603]|uniref:Uncharacterized protein n=2 Tax=Mucilaginibacter TaxID=423349 RepID=H1Y421_9SPHI|nr:hypothetical protein Mucpa_0565 [Mucilaginibacter paludis DSM 18603]
MFIQAHIMEEAEKSNPESPDFSTLTGIMERFHRVPYEQFQKELNDWFTGNLREQGIDLNTLQEDGIIGLPNLISEIYHRAEVLQIMSENQIKGDHEDK